MPRERHSPPSELQYKSTNTNTPLSRELLYAQIKDANKLLCKYKYKYLASQGAAGQLVEFRPRGRLGRTCYRSVGHFCWTEEFLNIVE